MGREMKPQMVGNLEMVVYGMEKMIREGWQPNNNLQLRGRVREKEEKEEEEGTKPTKGERKVVGGW